MVWDGEWNPSEYAPSAADKGHGPVWERLNNQLFLEWQRFSSRLEEYAEERERVDRRPLTVAERGTHTGRFRDMLHEVYGRSAVDSRWEAERANRLEARERPSGKKWNE